MVLLKIIITPVGVVVDTAVADGLIIGQARFPFSRSIKGSGWINCPVSQTLQENLKSTTTLY
jgi:hypothetical protein